MIILLVVLPLVLCIGGIGPNEFRLTPILALSEDALVLRIGRAAVVLRAGRTRHAVGFANASVASSTGDPARPAVLLAVGALEVGIVGRYGRVVTVGVEDPSAVVAAFEFCLFEHKISAC